MKLYLLTVAAFLASLPDTVQAQHQFGRETVDAPIKVGPIASQSTSLRPTASCTLTTTLDFAQRPDNEDWKNHAPVVVGGSPNNTTISTGGSYIEPTSGTETSLTVIPAASNNLGVKNLFWSTNYTNQNNATTQITYSFNRPVNNMSLTLMDIDRNTSNFIDEVTLDAQQADGVTLNMGNTADATVAIVNTAYVSRNGNTLVAQQQTTDGQNTGTVTVTFNKPIVKLVITYRNTYPIADPGVQYIGINSMSWCTQANVATTLSGPARVNLNNPVIYTVSTTASGDYAAPNVQPQVQLVPGLNSQSPVFPAGSTYNNTTGLLTLATIPSLAVGATSTATIQFNMPSSTVTGKASSTIGNDDADPTDNNGSLANANVTTTVNQAPTAQNKSTTVSATTTVFTPIPAMTGIDPDGDALTIYRITDISGISFGKLYYTNGITRTQITAPINLTPAQAATLEFQNASGVLLPTATQGNFTYTVTDALNSISSPATYTIRIADQPAVYSSPNTYTAASLNKNQILATLTDPDGSITTATITSGTLPNNMSFSTTTGAFSVSGQGNGVIAAGTYTFTVSTTGLASGASTNVPVTIKIIGTDAEAAYSTGNTFNRDALLAGNTLATVTDPDGNITSATIATGTLGTGMSFNSTTGLFTVGSAVPFAGTYTYTVNTTDAYNGTSTPSVTITIRDDQEAAYTANRSVNRDALSNGSSLSTVSDADGSITSATVSSGSLPAGTTLNTSTGAFTVSNVSALANGTYSFAVSTVDATGGRTTSNVGVTLFETEAVYTVAAAPSGVYTNGYSLATVSDADGNISNAANNTALPAGVGLNATTGQFTVTNRLLLRPGTYPVQVTTNDVTGGITTQTVNIVIKNNPLPVTLTSFTAQAAGQDAKITWTTAQEVNNDHFVVERSANGQQFEVVQEVQGQGTKASATTYTITDIRAAAYATNGTVYYRLRQVDTDGTESLSAVQTVFFSAAKAATVVLPNPSATSQDAQLDLTGVTGRFQVTITDVAGRVVRTSTQQGGTVEALGTQGLTKGVYVVRVQGSNQSFVHRLVKE